jgi:hypothetical protein
MSASAAHQRLIVADSSLLRTIFTSDLGSYPRGYSFERQSGSRPSPTTLLARRVFAASLQTNGRFRSGRAGGLSEVPAELLLVTFAEVAPDDAAVRRHHRRDVCSPYIRLAPEMREPALPQRTEAVAQIQAVVWSTQCSFERLTDSRDLAEVGRENAPMVRFLDQADAPAAALVPPAQQTAIHPGLRNSLDEKDERAVPPTIRDVAHRQ